MTGEVHYPADHRPGMRVPKGGSMCQNCRYVKGQTCTQKDWIAWHGSSTIPAPVDSYCSDWYEPRKPVHALSEALSAASR